MKSQIGQKCEQFQLLGNCPNQPNCPYSHPKLLISPHVIKTYERTNINEDKSKYIVMGMREKFEK